MFIENSKIVFITYEGQMKQLSSSVNWKKKRFAQFKSVSRCIVYFKTATS